MFQHVCSIKHDVFVLIQREKTGIQYRVWGTDSRRREAKIGSGLIEGVSKRHRYSYSSRMVSKGRGEERMKEIYTCACRHKK